MITGIAIKIAKSDNITITKWDELRHQLVNQIGHYADMWYELGNDEQLFVIIYGSPRYKLRLQDELTELSYNFGNGPVVWLEGPIEFLEGKVVRK